MLNPAPGMPAQPEIAKVKTRGMIRPEIRYFMFVMSLSLSESALSLEATFCGLCLIDLQRPSFEV